MTPVERAKLKEAFSLFDKRGDGVVPVGDTGRMLQFAGLAPSLQEIDQCVRAYVL